jgi:3-hydroxyacyl-[acyl-carrier-protein] dehydratase
VRAHRLCKPGDILSLSVKPKRMKMPLATFEGSIRVGADKAVIAEEITLTFGFVDIVEAPTPVAAAAAQATPEPTPAAPLRVAVNA